MSPERVTSIESFDQNFIDFSHGYRSESNMWYRPSHVAIRISYESLIARDVGTVELSKVSVWFEISNKQ